MLPGKSTHLIGFPVTTLCAFQNFAKFLKKVLEQAKALLSASCCLEMID